MIGKDSISFGSIGESSVWHNQDPPVPGQKNSITFNQFPATSRNYLDESTIKRLPTGKTTQQVNSFMRNNLDVVCLLQAAQIKRLVTNLQQHQIKFKQLHNQPLNRQSYQIQIRQLTQQYHTLQLQNEQSNNKCQKLKQFIIKQNAEIMKLSQQIKQKDHYEKQMANAVRTQYQAINRKYDKSLESLNKLFDDNQQLTVQKIQLQEENGRIKQQIIILKQHIFQLQQRKQVFQQQRIREIQRMRQSYEIKIHQNSVQQRQQIQAITKLEQINKQIHQKNISLTKNITTLSQQLKMTQSKFIASMQQIKKLQMQLKRQRDDTNKEREKSNFQREDFCEKFTMFGDEIQRLNSVLINKQQHLKDMYEEINRIKVSNQSQAAGSSEKMRNTINERQKQVSELKSNVDLFQRKISELTVENKKHLTFIQKQQEEYIQRLNKNNQLKRQEIQNLNARYENNLISLKQQIQRQKRLIVQEYQNKIKDLGKQRGIEYENRINAYQNQIKSLSLNLQQQKAYIQKILSQTSQATSSQQSIIVNYEQKIRQYFQQIQKLKKQITLARQQNQYLNKQNSKVKLQHTQLTFSNQTLTEQIKVMSQQYAQIKTQKTLIQAKLKNLERQKVKIQRQLQTQIVNFMENNHKTTLLLHEHNAKMEKINYHQLYSSNHTALLAQVERIYKDLLSKEDENKKMKAKIDQLQNILVEFRQQEKLHFGSIIKNLEQKDGTLFNIQSKISKLDEKNILINKNIQLNDRVLYLQVERKQYEAITQKVVTLTTQNIKLKHDLQLSIKELEVAKNSFIDFQTKSMRKAPVNPFYEQNQQQIQSAAKSTNDKKIEQLLSQFKELNQSLLMKLSAIQKNQSQALSRIRSKNDIQNNNLPTIAQSQSQVYNPQMTNSNVVQTNMSFNPSKFLSVTKLPEDSQLNEVMSQLKILKQQFSLIQRKCQELHKQNQTLYLRNKNMQIELENYFNQNKEFQNLCKINKNLIEENNNLIQENDEMMDQLKNKDSKILQISTTHQEIDKEMKTLTRKYKDLLEMNQDYAKKLGEIQILKNQLKNNAFIVHNYNQKIVALQRNIDIFHEQIQIYCLQHKKLEQKVHMLQHQNGQLQKKLQFCAQSQAKFHSQRQSLKKINFNLALQLQKSKLSHGKVQVLNQQLSRLQKQNIDLIEQLDICKFQIYGQTSLQRRNQQLMTMLVLGFVEIESLRARVRQKDDQIKTIRKSNLNAYTKY